MVRLTIEVVEENIAEAVGEEDAPSVRDSIVRYAREVAFATAEVYARAAEMRGAWDARLEALVVDSVLRAEADETVRSRASALGWESKGAVVVVLGRVPYGEAAGRARESIIDDVRRSARHVGLDALCAMQGDRMVVVLGRRGQPGQGGRRGGGPLRGGSGGRRTGRPRPGARQHLGPRGDRRAARRAGLAGRPAPGDERRPAPRAGPVRRRPRAPAAGPGGLPAARRRPASATLETVSSFLDHGGSIEGTARAMFVHANTVRYRLRRAAEMTGLTPNDPRHAYTYRVALTLGRLTAPDSTTPADPVKRLCRVPTRTLPQSSCAPSTRSAAPARQS